MAANPLLRALRGRRSLRRRVADLDNDRFAAIAQHFEGRDGRRDRSFIRRDLERILQHEREAAPIRARRALQERAVDPRITPFEQRDLRRQLRETRSTVNDQRNPLRWGSVARQRFGDLYRR